METEQWVPIFQTKAKQLNRRHVWNLVFDDSIEPNEPKSGWKQYKRSACARFNCSMCNRGWPSNRVMVVFNMRKEYNQGTVKVKPFRQCCKQCNDAPMEEAKFSSENIAILLEKLVENIKIKFYNATPPKRNRYFRNVDVDGPHEAAHCEACRRGICGM